MPRAQDMPPVLDVMMVPATTNPLGVKGAGEAATTAAIAAVMNAIADAVPGGGADRSNAGDAGEGVGGLPGDGRISRRLASAARRGGRLESRCSTLQVPMPTPWQRVSLEFRTAPCRWDSGR